MRLIDADEAKKQVRQMQVLKPSEKNLLTLALDRTPTYEPPNDPLTPEQLREMDRKPVWICDPDGSDGMWALVDLEYELCRTATGGIAIFDTYGKTWLAYRRKPEERTTA